MYPFERFSENAKRLLTYAQAEAERQRKSYIGTEHLVLGLIADEDGTGGRALKELGVDEGRVRKDIDAGTTRGTDFPTQITPTSPVKRVIEISFEEARREGTDYVGTEHVLMALLIEGDDSGAKLLMAQGVTLDRARSAVDRLRGAGAREGRGIPTRFASVESILTSYPVERFSTTAQAAVVLAAEEAKHSNHSYLGTEHLVVGLMRQDGLASSALKAMGVELEPVRQAIESVLGGSERTIVQQIVPTSRVRKIFQIAVEESGRENSPNTNTGHLLLALLTEGEGIAAHVLKDLRVTPEEVKGQVDRLSKSGMLEPGGQPTPHGYRHVEIQDSQGRLIGVDVIFPPGYPGDESDSVIAGIKKALTG